MHTTNVRPARPDDIGPLASLMIEFCAEADLALLREAAERTFSAGHVLLARPLADAIHQRGDQ